MRDRGMGDDNGGYGFPGAAHQSVNVNLRNVHGPKNREKLSHAISRLGERAGIESLSPSGNRSQLFRTPRFTSHVGHEFALFRTMKVSGGLNGVGRGMPIAPICEPPR